MATRGSVMGTSCAAGYPSAPPLGWVGVEPEVNTIPARVRLELAHAAVQRVAELSGADVFHLKGLALDPALVWEGRSGSDVDVLVRPAHLAAFLDALSAAGWRIETDFDENSSFAHAATYWSDTWGHVDVHRFYPGLSGSPSDTFDQLTRHARTRTLGGVECPVPTVGVQRLVLLLHAARGMGGKELQDLKTSWFDATPAQQDEVRALVDEFGAQLAFAAALGHLDKYRTAREYDLWRVASQGGTRFEDWWARIKAAPTRREALLLVLRAPLVNVRHLAALWGRTPTKREILREFFARPARGVREEIDRLREEHA